MHELPRVGWSLDVPDGGAEYGQHRRHGCFVAIDLAGQVQAGSGTLCFDGEIHCDHCIPLGRQAAAALHMRHPLLSCICR